MAYAMGSGSGGGEDDVPGSPPPTVGNVSPFLWKTYNLVSDERTDHILSWTSNGRAFTVWRPDLMERELLPKTFKHSNFASFVRQLNNYGFHKVHSDRYEFAADGFQSGRPDLLHVRSLAFFPFCFRSHTLFLFLLISTYCMLAFPIRTAVDSPVFAFIILKKVNALLVLDFRVCDLLIFKRG